MTPAKPAHERVLAKVSVEDLGHTTPCWLWQGSILRGYGRIDVRIAPNKRIPQRTHRVVYAALVEPIAGGMTLDHLCEVKHCCNPDHLEQVTSVENVARYHARNPLDAHCANGHLRAANAYLAPNGTTKCRLCRNMAALRYKARRRAKAVNLAEFIPFHSHSINSEGQQNHGA